jgi:nicotinamide mononucleotide transporter
MSRRIEALIAKHDSATAARPPVLSYEPAPPRSPVRGGWILALLALGTTAAAAAMYFRGATTLLEAISFVSGAVCVWLTVRENVWNFPIGLLNVATFAVVFFHARLFADASLQVVYVVLTLIGWYWWLYGGERRTTLRVTRTGRAEAIVVSVVGVVLTLALWRTLRLIGGSASFWDALTTALSLCAQWLLNRKRLENWHVWIAADLIYVPLYAYKGLYLTSVLYAAFFGMCVVGLAEWRATHRRLSVGGAR